MQIIQCPVSGDLKMVLFGSSGPNKEYALTSAVGILFSSFNCDNRSKPEKLEYVLNLTCRLSGLSMSFTAHTGADCVGAALGSCDKGIFSWCRFINWFFLNDWLLWTGLWSWLNGGWSFTLTQTTSLFKRVSLEFFSESGLPGFHLGSTYSGTFHTEGGGLGGSLSLPSDCDRCLAKYRVVKTGDPGILRDDLAAADGSSFLTALGALDFVFTVSSLWAEFCWQRREVKSWVNGYGVQQKAYASNSFLSQAKQVHCIVASRIR